MPNERNYYVICEDNCKFPGMTSEQILAAIAEATGSTPTHVDDAFITKIREMNQNKNLKFWIGTTAQFNALATKAADTLYILSDDDTEESIEASLTAHGQMLTEIYDASKTLTISNVTTNDFVLVTDSYNSVYNVINHGTYMVRVEISYNGENYLFSTMMEFYGGDTFMSALLKLTENIQVMVVAEKASASADYWQYKLKLKSYTDVEYSVYKIWARQIGKIYPVG